MVFNGYTDKFKRLGREYLFQTSIDNSRKQVVSSLFHAGQLLNSIATPFQDASQGEKLFEKALSFHKQNLGDLDSLLGLAERMRSLEKPDIIEKLGKSLCARQLYDEGLELLLLASQKYPESPGLHHVLGKLYLAKGQVNDAETEFGRAVDLAPDFPDYRNALGIAYLKSNKAVAAISEFKKAVTLNIYFDKAYFNLGLGYIANGIIREDFNLAKNLVQNSMDALQKAALFNPAYNTDKYTEGLEFLNEGEYEKAYSTLSKVAEEHTSRSAEEHLVELYLRYIHNETGMSEEGINNFIERIKDLLKLNPGYADLHNELGMAYTILCKFMNDKAIYHFQEALKINPNFTKAVKNLKLSKNDLKGFEILLEAILK